MSVRYITVTPVANFFQPATRAFGDIAVVGEADPTASGPRLTGIPITNPDSITYTATNALAAAITDPTATTLTVSSAAGFPTPLTSFQIRIDQEALNVTAMEGTGGTTWTVTRGVNGTTAAAHAQNATVTFTNGNQTITTTLTAAVTAAATTIAVRSTTGFPPLGFNVQIDSETLTVTAFGGTNNTTWTVTRGAAGSTAATHAQNAAVTYASNGSAVDDFVWFPGDLATSVRKTFAQTPGPTLVWAIQTDSTNSDPWGSALSVSDKIDVQIVFLANTPLNTANQATLQKLADHVTTVSNTGADGMECIGVVMLANGAAPPTLANDLTTSAARLVYIAHKSNEDAAAAVAGTIAGYQPQISLLLKPVNLAMTDTFADSEIDAFKTARHQLDHLADPDSGQRDVHGRGLHQKRSQHPLHRHHPHHRRCFLSPEGAADSVDRQPAHDPCGAAHTRGTDGFRFGTARAGGGA